MGLTRIRAEQISDIDYKQAVRVITLSDVTLSGGAPATVDGVNLVAGNRVLVAGQSTGSQNGLYVVQTVGAGNNGTWIRSSDGNADGEIEAGMIVMVTEGTVYKDTQWKLTTNDPIIIGTTPLVFEQNSAYAFGNISANGTAVLANSVGSTVIFTAGDNISITGNNTTKTVTFAVTGITTSRIANGTSNVDIATANSNVTVGVSGSEVAEFSTEGLDVTGNITGNYFIGNGATLSGINAFGNIAVAGETTVSADNTSDTLTFAAGDGIAITTDAANNSIIIASISQQSIFATGGDMGLVTQAPIDEEDLGLITDAVTESYDLGSVVQQFAIEGNLAGNLIGNGHSIIDLATLSVLGDAEVGNLTANGNVLPSANVTYNIGSADKRWNDLWLANSTIHLGEVSISATGGNLELPATVQIGNITLTESNGNLVLPANTDLGGSPATTLGKAIAMTIVFG